MLGFQLKRVLCLSPHPDDVELSMFGTILKYPETQFDVLCLSIGGQYDPSSSPQRHKEIRDFWKASGCSNVKLFFMEGFLGQNDEGRWIAEIEKAFSFWAYQAIFIPPHEDAHFEHRLVSQIGQALTRKGNLGLFEYRTVSTLAPWCPNFFVDITDQYQSKINHLHHISSQAKKPYFEKEVLNALHSDIGSLKRGVAKVEMYRVLQATCTAKLSLLHRKTTATVPPLTAGEAERDFARGPHLKQVKI